MAECSYYGVSTLS